MPISFITQLYQLVEENRRSDTRSRKELRTRLALGKDRGQNTHNRADPPLGLCESLSPLRVSSSVDPATDEGP